MKCIDLHIHTNQSDGTIPPYELVYLASDTKLSVIAITDHDTVSGIPDALKASEELAKKGTTIEVIPGIELSAACSDHEVHILGYFIDYKNEIFLQTIHKLQTDREERNLKMIQKFQAGGIPVTLEDLKNEASSQVVSRIHFARFLSKNHYAADQREAFKRYLSSSSPFYVKRKYISAEDAIHFIKKAGGLPVLAHPLLYDLSIDKLDQLICFLKETGLIGIETFYSANTNLDEGIVRKFANKYNLVMTGGSDFHGVNKPHISLGIGRGNLKIPYSVFKALKNCQTS